MNYSAEIAGLMAEGHSSTLRPRPASKRAAAIVSTYCCGIQRVIVPEERTAELSRDLDRRYARRQPFALNEPGVRFTRGVSF